MTLSDGYAACSMQLSSGGLEVLHVHSSNGVADPANPATFCSVRLRGPDLRLKCGRCRWEGTPAANINITSNTVVDCAYDPSAGSGQPAISVYAGTDNLNATTPIQTNITISGNLVIGGAVRCLLSAHHSCGCFG